MSVVGAIALTWVLVSLLVAGVYALFRLLAGAIDDAVVLPGRGRHRTHGRATRAAGRALREEQPSC